MQDGQKSIHLPWNQHDHYWLCVRLSTDGETPTLEKILAGNGFKSPARQNFLLKSAGKNWKAEWDAFCHIRNGNTALQKAEVAVIAGQQAPEEQNILANWQSTESLSAIADALWLGDALLNGQLKCYLQPVVDKRGKIFGYESFARVESSDGQTIGGDKIIQACKILNIEHVVDRQLHVQAIKTFTGSDVGGFLFVNFVPGFIHRPEIYLEGLTETAQKHGMPAKHIVLDFTKSETPRDMAHLKRIIDYCRSKGYAAALDDIESVEMADKLIHQIKPDFVKLDIALVRRMQNRANFDLIRTLVDITHANGGTVIAEGVETEEIHTALLQAGADLFQGYLFSPPIPAEKIAKQAAS